MAKITLTNEEVALKRQVAQNWINQNPERSRFHFALEKFLQRTKRIVEDFGDAESDIRAETALQENGKFVYMDVGTPMKPEKMLVVDPAKAKDLQKRLRENGRKEVSFEGYYCPKSDIPKDLEAAWMQHFVGLVIENDPFAETEAIPEPEMAVAE